MGEGDGEALWIGRHEQKMRREAVVKEGNKEDRKDSIKIECT